MPFKDLLKKRDKLSNDKTDFPKPPLPQASEFKFMRVTTNTAEEVHPPAFDGDDEPRAPPPHTPKKTSSRSRKNSSTSSKDSPLTKEKEHKRLSERLRFGPKSRSSSSTSVNVPADLPVVEDAYSPKGDNQEKEARWEQRATVLAKENPVVNAGPPPTEMSQRSPGVRNGVSAPSDRPRSVSDQQTDADIQEAIRLHESGQLPEATEMFHTLAEQGNVLSQVLYGLSLRHGWGCQPDHTRAITYLSAAAANSASIESEALKSGMKKGGVAKGELVLSIFELANCFRNGWGAPVDKVAARQYYETAANLGDTDAMNEAAWCYLEGFGGKKDKFKAAQLLRLAEKSGAKTLGNTWIWKEKYNPK